MEKPQFTLAAMLATITAIAGVLALMFQAPMETANRTLLLLVPVCFAFAVIGIVQGSTVMRSFCIGALIPVSMLLFYVLMKLGDFPHWFSKQGMGTVTSMSTTATKLYGGGLLLSITLGYLCIGVSWLVSPRN